ncbi:unnamed protein product [Orchesella dallaii]|uniref:Uncharacterized protein n=1 Tax=Orchesella dallaii TaxID=48710 RepID=A0ABP1Q6K6_9HEXA
MFTMFCLQLLVNLLDSPLFCVSSCFIGNDNRRERERLMHLEKERKCASVRATNKLFLWITSSLFLLSSNVVFVASKCEPNGTLLQYAGYEEECIVGGYEKFTLQYKRKTSLNAREAIKNFECKLCDPEQYLDCYTATNSDTGTCRCVSTHSKGYILVYDDSVKSCRGSLGSTCNRAVFCHEKLKCEFGICICDKGSTDCDKVPSPLEFLPYKISRAILHPPIYELSLMITMKCFYHLFHHLQITFL